MTPQLKEFVPYNIALKLSRLGYNNKTQGYYNIYNKHMFFSKHVLHNEAIWAPTYEEVLDWFQTVHNIGIEPTEEGIIEAINKISLKI